jgi:hypothetical protein
MGVARVSYARMLPAAALMAMGKALDLLMDSAVSGAVHDRPDLLVGIEDITSLMGYAFIDELESSVLSDAELERKYRDQERSFVIKGKH